MSEHYDHYQQSVFDKEPPTRVPVSAGIRFANFIVDMIVVYGLVFALAFGLGLLSPAFANYAYEQSDDFGFMLVDRIVTAVAVALIFTLIEGLTKGRTLGKLITGTVAVREDGQPFTWSDALKRSFSRIVPFEPFSAFGGHPWHDKWSHTLVIRKSDS